MISRRSRYASSILFTDGPQEFLGARGPIDTSPRQEDRFHTVVEGDRLDSLAHRYLGRADLWWVIAEWNGLAWPLDLEAGITIRLPSEAVVHIELG